MYSEAELEAAVAAGAISTEAATALRDFVAARRDSPVADEEHFRLITGFNDIFVTIATILLLVAVAWLAGAISPAMGAFAAGIVSWGLAEYFVRRRRMALPAILLLTIFTWAAFAAGFVLSQAAIPAIGETSKFIVGAACAVLAAIAHWRRFHVPITIAVGASATVALVITLLLASVPALAKQWMPLVLIGGLSLFALAMRWDMSDRARVTRRSDVAYWLHLAAAPVIVHPAFAWLGLLDSEQTDLTRVVSAVVLYGGLAVVALIVDRRALLISALFYVLYAVSVVLRAAGTLSASLALTALIVGSALLLLSAFWHPARRAVLALAPRAVRARVPAI